MTRALVTGATGMVGGALVARLVEEGAEVVALVRDPDPRSALYRSGLADRVTVVAGVLEDYAAVERAVNDHEVDTVFHLAAQTIVGAAHRSPLAAFEANVRGTWHVLEAARRLPGLVRAVVVASSDKAYGARPDLPYREDHPLAGGAPYEVSKSCADLIARSYAVTYGVPVGVARCGNIYGPGDLNWSRIVPGTVRSLLRGEQPVLRSDGTFLRDYLYVEDVVDAYLALARAVADGVGGSADMGFNFSDEAPRTVMELYRAVCRAVTGGEVEPKVLDRAASEIHDQYLSAAKARAELGWEARWGLDQGLTETVKWYGELLGADR